KNESQHVVGGDAVLPPAQATGVRCDVAADRADLIRGRVRRIPQTVLGRRRLDLEVEGPWLDDGNPGRDIDLDGAHSFQTQNDASGNRRGSAREAASGPAWHDRYPILGCPSNCSLHLRSVTRSDHCDRDSGSLVPGPVEAVVFAADRIGAHRIAESRGKLLQRRFHAAQTSPVCAAPRKRAYRLLLRSRT